MKIRSIRVCLKQGMQGIWRNRLMVLASVCTVSACLFILGIVYCLVANVRQFADDLDDSLWFGSGNIDPALDFISLVVGWETNLM